MNKSSVLVVLGLTLLLLPFEHALAGTAFKTGEETVGFTKTCYYDYLGSTHTKTISNVALCPLTIQVGTGPPGQNNSSRPPAASYGTAFKTGEVTRGMTKTCYYDYLGSQYTKTVSNVSLCPLTIRVKIN